MIRNVHDDSRSRHGGRAETQSASNVMQTSQVIQRFKNTMLDTKWALQIGMIFL